MSIFEVGTSRLGIHPPEFKCDDPIGPGIEPPLPEKAFAMALIGAPGSGKTSLIVDMLTDPMKYQKKFDHIHLIAPEQSVASLKEDIWRSHPPEKMHTDVSPVTIASIENRCKARAMAKPKAETTLLIIDDMAVFLKQKAVEEKLRDLIFKRRHIRLSICLLVQSFKAMPLDLRKSLSHFVLFRPRNKKEAEAIWEELLFVPKQVGETVLQYTYQDEHDFLFGDVDKGLLHRNFNLLNIDNSNKTPGAAPPLPEG